MYNSIIVVPKICVLITDCLKLLKTIKTCGIACEFSHWLSNWIVEKRFTFMM